MGQNQRPEDSDTTSADTNKDQGETASTQVRLPGALSVPAPVETITGDRLKSTVASAFVSLVADAQRPEFSGLTIDSPLIKPASSLMSLVEDAAIGGSIVRSALQASTPSMLSHEASIIGTVRSALDSGAVIRALDSNSAIGKTAFSHLYTRDSLTGFVVLPSDTMHAIAGLASTNVFEYPKATDAISALSSSIVTTSALRDSLGAGMRASDFLTTHVKATDVLTSSLAHLDSIATLDVARSGVVLAHSALSGLTSIAASGRQYLGKSAVISASEAAADSNIFAAAQHLTAPYFGAVASVVSLESRLNDIATGSIPRSAVNLISGSALSPLRENLSVLSWAASDAWKTFGDVVAVPQSSCLLGWLRKPATELYTAVQVVAAVSLEPTEEVEFDEEIEAEIDEQDGAFEARLRRLDPDLITVYRGGIEALQRGATDWQRHSMVSFRELAMHVLHKLSPDEEVKKIASEVDIVKGKPTRAVRLRYIYGNVANGIVTGFFTADTRATIELFDLLNNGTHRLGESATLKQARFLKSRLVGLIGSMLEARGY